MGKTEGKDEPGAVCAWNDEERGGMQEVIDLATWRNPWVVACESGIPIADGHRLVILEGVAGVVPVVVAVVAVARVVFVVVVVVVVVAVVVVVVAVVIVTVVVVVVVVVAPVVVVVVAVAVAVVGLVAAGPLPTVRVK